MNVGEFCQVLSLCDKTYQFRIIKSYTHKDELFPTTYNSKSSKINTFTVDDSLLGSGVYINTILYGTKSRNIFGLTYHDTVQDVLHSIEKIRESVVTIDNKPIMGTQSFNSLSISNYWKVCHSRRVVGLCLTNEYIHAFYPFDIWSNIS